MASDEREISLEEIKQIIRNIAMDSEESSENETVNVRPPGYQGLTETLENTIIKAVICKIHEDKDPEPDVKFIVMQAVRMIMTTVNNCITEDYALMTRKIYKALDEEGYWS